MKLQQQERRKRKRKMPEMTRLVLDVLMPWDQANPEDDKNNPRLFYSDVATMIQNKHSRKTHPRAVGQCLHAIGIREDCKPYARLCSRVVGKHEAGYVGPLAH